MVDRDAIRTRFETAAAHLSERGRRLLAAAEARAAGRGGLLAVSQATGLARSTTLRGLNELNEPPLPSGAVRRQGGGRAAASHKNPTLLDDLKVILEPAEVGDPMRPL